MKRYLLARYEIFNQEFFPLENSDKIKDAQVNFILLPFSYGNKKILNFFKSIVEQDKNNKNNFVFFEDFRTRDFAELGIQPFFFKEAWTNIDSDIRIHGKVLEQFKKMAKDVDLVRVEIYEYLLFRERLLHVVRNATNSKRPVFFVLNGKAITTVSLNEVCEILSEEGFSVNQFLLLPWHIFLLKAKNATSKWKIKAFTFVNILHKNIRAVFKRLLNIPLKLIYLWNSFYRLSWFKNKQGSINAPESLSGNSPIAIFYTGNTDSKYWQALFIVIEEIKKRKLAYLCIVDNPLSYAFLLCKKINCYLVKPELGAITFDQTVLVEPVGAKKRFIGYAPLRAQLFNNLKRLYQELNIKKAVLLPHWSNLGSLALSLKQDQEKNMKLISFPVVTVNDNHASIIGWEGIDEIYCYGQQCITAFKNMGYPEKKLKLCGNILMDPPLNRLNNQQEKIILIATSRLDVNENLWIKDVAQYAKIHHYKCIIKVHPSFSYEDYSSLKTNNPSLSILTSVKDLYSLIERCELCITDCSTVGAEAVILNKMLLVVNLTGKKFNANPYEELGVALEAKTLPEVALCLDKILNDPATQENLRANYPGFYEQYNYLNDGKAVERLINGLLN